MNSIFEVQTGQQQPWKSYGTLPPSSVRPTPSKEPTECSGAPRDLWPPGSAAAGHRGQTAWLEFPSPVERALCGSGPACVHVCNTHLQCTCIIWP